MSDSGTSTSLSYDVDVQISNIIENEEPLYIFGYGSLCWNPGDGILSHPTIRKTFGVVLGYRRCWSQKSTDHRGKASFPGLVCTLLTEKEFRDIADEYGGTDNADDGVTGGLVYRIPKELTRKCLEELNFREKEGYARDVIDVFISDDHDEYLDDDASRKEKSDPSTKTLRALVYRGTPENPEFSARALFDEMYAASITSVANGPSGKNSEYLYQLNDFLSDHAHALNKAANCTEGDSNCAATKRLTDLSKTLQNYRLYFLFGSGSNQHDQLLLNSSKNQRYNSAGLVNDDEAHTLKELVLVVPKIEYNDDEGVRDESIYTPKKLFAGGGHSGLLTHRGDLYLWGWNEDRQLGREGHDNDNEGYHLASHPIIPPLDIKVEDAALGYNHTLVIEKESRILYAFGANNRGQAGGQDKSGTIVRLDYGKFVHISTGLFHSAGITENGELVTFGCQRFGQSLCTSEEQLKIGKWKPCDGSNLVKVACGRRHTVVLDEHGRVWTMGDNKYNQLGRTVESGHVQKMELVDGILGQKGSGCKFIDCGWSHTIALVESDEFPGHISYGWGRNDKGQIVCDGSEEPTVRTPRRIKHALESLKGACCGSESISILDNQNNLMSSGWNEHGNLGIGHSTNVSELTEMIGSKICSSYHDDSDKEDGEIIMASGGAHFLATIRGR